MTKETQESLFSSNDYTEISVDIDQYELVWVQGYWRRKKIKKEAE